MQNVVAWFEIPVINLDRAVDFYSQVMGIKMDIYENEGKRMAFFPYQPGIASGGLVEGNENQPSQTGTLIYLNGGEDLSVPLSRVKSAGGAVVQDKMSIGEHGFIALFTDTEGNRVAFHSMK